MRYFVLLLCFCFFNCSGQPSDCSKFKTGTFKYNHSDYKGHVIERSDSLQIEYNDKDDIRIISTINWVSDCEYILTYKDIENYPKKDSVIGKKINVKIIKSKGLSYICNIKSNSLDSKIEITKVK